MEYLMKRVEEKDLHALVELCRKHAEFEHSEYNPENKIALLKSILFSEEPKLNCFVIEVDSMLAGYYSYTFDISTWDANPFLYLDCLYLEPAYRGLRIGEKVFDNLRLIAAKNNCLSIQWQTPVFNKRAIKFYERIGGIGKQKQRFFISIK